MPEIHPLSLVDPSARLADDVRVGPFCIVGPDVEIGAGTVLMSHVTVQGRTRIGRRNRIFQGAAVGCEPQDKKYRGEDTRLEIGDDNVIREHCTVSVGTVQDEGLTVVGSRNLLMANAHVAHDCVIGNDCIIANNVALAGHVHLEDFVIIGGQGAVHQFVHIGTHAMLGGGGGARQDIPPYVMASGLPCVPYGLNLVGLRRMGLSNDSIRKLQQCYRAVYREGNLLADAEKEIRALIESSSDEGDRARMTHFLEFVTTSARGIIR